MMNKYGMATYIRQIMSTIPQPDGTPPSTEAYADAVMVALCDGITKGISKPELLVAEMRIADTLPQIVDSIITSAPIAHNLGLVPLAAKCFIKCQIADAGYMPGDVCFANAGLIVSADETNLRVTISSNVYRLVDKTTGAPANAAYDNWGLWVIACAQSPESTQTAVRISDSLPQIVDGAITIAPVAHNYANTPSEVKCYIKCKIADAGYMPGDACFDAVSNAGLIVSADETNLRVTVFSTAYRLINKTTGAPVNAAYSNWELWAALQ